MADARGSIQFDYDMDVSNSEKQDFETEKPPTPARRKSQSVDSNNGVSLHNIIHSKERNDNDVPMMPQTPYTAPAVDDCAVPAASPPIRKTSFATLPNNTTTWQQQSVNYQATDSHSEFHHMFHEGIHIHWICEGHQYNCPFVCFPVDEDRPNVDASKLSTVRMKLEEKRRQIEQEKRKMEVALSRQQQKVGKAAFLQAINKVLNSHSKIKTRTILAK